MQPPVDEPEPRRAFPGPNAPRAPAYKFTEEELRVIKDCNRESFYKRCLPYSVLLAGGTYLGVKNGYLRPNPRWGPTPKVVVATMIGYFVGKFSYQKKCAEKLMQLPNSQLGEMLRQRRRGAAGRRDTIDSDFGALMGPFGSIKESDVYSDLNPNNSLDMDTSRPDNPGLDDHHRPSMDNPAAVYEDEMPPEQKHTTTYEELRKKNREDYQQQRIGNWKEAPKAASPPPPQAAPVVDVEDNSSKYGQVPQQPKNKYGDIWG